MTNRPSDERRPLIVITAVNPSARSSPEIAARKNELYAAAIRRNGGEPAILHADVPEPERHRLLEAMDGLVLSGGADIDPALYGDVARGAVDVDVARDRLELEAWGEAERRGLPVLGICRGLQAINVFSGGSLIQDVPDHAGTPYGRGPTATHRLRIEPSSLLGSILLEEAVVGAPPAGAPELTVNTFHHQAVGARELAPALSATAWSESSMGPLVEGLEGRGPRWLVAVQCHPERQESTPGAFERLWRAFVRAAAPVAADSRA